MTLIEKIFYHPDLAIFIKILFLLGITQINLVFALAYNKIRSLAAQKLLPSVVIIASFGIVQASLTLPSLIARSRATDYHRYDFALLV